MYSGPSFIRKLWPYSTPPIWPPEKGTAHCSWVAHQKDLEAAASPKVGRWQELIFKKQQQKNEESVDSLECCMYK